MIDTQALTVTVIERRRWHKLGTLRSRWDIDPEAVQQAPDLLTYRYDKETCEATPCQVCKCTGAAFYPFITLTKWGTVASYKAVGCCKHCGTEFEI